MFASFKELILLIASVVIVAHATGQREWIWKQIATIRQAALGEAKRDWGCPSIFNKDNCHTINSR